MEVCNNTVFERTDCFYVFVCLTVHLLRSTTYSDGSSRGSVARYDRRLIHNDFIVLNDNGIRGTKIYGYFLSKEADKTHTMVIS